MVLNPFLVNLSEKDFFMEKNIAGLGDLNKQIEYLKGALSGKDTSQIAEFKTIRYPAIDAARMYNSLLHQCQNKLGLPFK
jgi:hypothetical protein